MGADLICFIAKGPVRLDKTKRTAALNQALAAISTLKRIAEIFDDKEMEESEAQKLLKKVDMTALRHLDDDNEAKRAITIHLDDWNRIDDYRYLFDKDPDLIVGDLLVIWNREDSNRKARDLSYRIDPDDPKQRIVVAGDMSWGDEPEGWAYQTLKAAFDTGITKIFGIK